MGKPNLSKKKGRPRKIYNSMAQAAAALDVSIDLIRHAKKCGCDAIRGNGSVDSEKLLAWISDHRKAESDWQSVAGLRDEKLKQEIRKLAFFNDQKEGLYVQRAQVSNVIDQCISKACDILDNRLVNEGVPRMVDTKDVPQVRTQVRREVDSAKLEIQKIRKLFDQL